MRSLPSALISALLALAVLTFNPACNGKQAAQVEEKKVKAGKESTPPAKTEPAKATTEEKVEEKAKGEAKAETPSYPGDPVFLVEASPERGLKASLELRPQAELIQHLGGSVVAVEGLGSLLAQPDHALCQHAVYRSGRGRVILQHELVGPAKSGRASEGI